MTDQQDFFSAAASLGTVETLDVATMELLIKVENSGEDFYNLLADRIGNEEGGRLLRRNGREEVGHARRISRAIAIKLGTNYEPSPELLERFDVPLPEVVGPSSSAHREGRPTAAATSGGPTTSPIPRSPGCCASTVEETKHGERAQAALAILEAAQA
jgi:hypothetical protein